MLSFINSQRKKKYIFLESHDEKKNKYILGNFRDFTSAEVCFRQTLELFVLKGLNLKGLNLVEMNRIW